MGDYRGRRRGPADSEPPQDGGQPRGEGRYGYPDDSGYYADEAFGGSNYRDGYQDAGDGQPEARPDAYGADYAAGYATDHPDYATDYAEPRFDFQQRSAPPEAPAYEQSYAPAYEQEQYGQQQYGQPQYQPEAYQPDPYGQPYAPADYGYDPEPAGFAAPEPEPYAPPQPAPPPSPPARRGARRGRRTAEPGHGSGPAPQDFTGHEPGYEDVPYDVPYDEPAYAPEGYAAEAYAPPRPEPRPEPRRGSRRGRPADENEYGPEGGVTYADAGHDRGYERDYERDYDRDYEGDDRRDPDAPYAPEGGDRRGAARAGAGSAPNHLPFIAGAAVAIIAGAFVSPEAVAAVTVLLQVAASFAVRDVLRLPGRRSVIVAAVPAAAATVGTFAFGSDVAATSVAAGIGAGFVLAAGDTVLRAGRRGVERGASRALAGSVSALLVACLTALLTAAARQSPTAAAIGGAVYGILAMAAARNRDLTVSRAVVLGLPAAGAALAAYAAAILVA